MKNLSFAPALLGMILAAPAFAQQPIYVIAQQPAAARPNADTAKPNTRQIQETWSYQQVESRYDDPASAVRRNAEFRGLQRRYRIASANWYGFSNSRPVDSMTPWWGTYRSVWASGVGRHRFAWPGTSWTY